MAMFDGRSEHMSRQLWTVTDSMLVMMHNLKQIKVSALLKPGHFDPWSTKKKVVAEPLTPEAVTLIKKAFGMK